MFGDDFNGGPAHIGKCEYCGKPNDTCFDFPHDDCVPLVKCPDCGMHFKELTSDGVCLVCFETAEP